MIEITQVSKQFGKLRALDHISLTCGPGQAIALIGPNGSGKTTLIKCLLGMVLPDEGTIRFQGQEIAGSWKYRTQIGYMPQMGRFPDNMTVAQVFDMMRDLRGNTAAGTDEELIGSFGLDRIMEKRMRTLSGGTRQKVSAALAFLFNANALILDEPTAGLDPVSSEVLKEKIRSGLEQGKLILITSHILSDLDDIVTEVVFLQEGKLQFHKSIAQLRADTEEVKLSRAIASVMRNT